MVMPVKKCALDLLRIAVLLAAVGSHGVAVIGQERHSGELSATVPWFLASDQRATVYDRIRFTSAPGGQGVYADALWITPLGAKAFVSSSLDRDHTEPADAATKVETLTSTESYFAVVWILGQPVGTSGVRPKVRLSTNRDKRGVEGEIVAPPFEMAFIREKTATSPGYLVKFPRVNGSGTPLIQALTDEIHIVVEYPGLATHLRVKAARLSDSLSDF